MWSQDEEVSSSSIVQFDPQGEFSLISASASKKQMTDSNTIALTDYKMIEQQYIKKVRLEQQQITDEIV